MYIHLYKTLYNPLFLFWLFLRKFNLVYNVHFKTEASNYSFITLKQCHICMCTCTVCRDLIYKWTMPVELLDNQRKL